MAGDVCIVMTTVADAAQAKALARTVIEARLAACAQTLPISSCYRWDGKIVEDGEQMILFKTLADQYSALEGFLLERHPYEVPEIVRLPVDGVSGQYRDWLLSEVG
ncbi:divalent-cation tolerance protein CutA [Afipia sp. 1NLS2]|uniref:divalent-cation tolerance protein CutA n=1 Tax=Afipia sp. 1NLS2 TaxID=666684 RepID=UPI0001D9E72B|nr:divalent-cation tolerance protein CutA [Afipia sp. 1NLS2]EFI50740.1 CutA1 divalent ion tolerance protein [Afipia sp. 1NLS2]